MNDHSWVEDFAGAVTVCDPAGIILAMNAKAAESFAAEGGRGLVGSNVFDCHPEPARSKLRQLMQDRTTNIYTIEKKGVRKLVYQAPWFQDGHYQGFVEIVLPLPAVLPHFVRDA